MPFVRIETGKGHYTDAQREAICEGIQRALSEIKVPLTERFQVFSQKATDDLYFDPGYLGIKRTPGFVAVQITLNLGRSAEDKKRLYAAIANNLASVAGVLPGDVFVNLVEVVRENWSFGEGQAQLA